MKYAPADFMNFNDFNDFNDLHTVLLVSEYAIYLIGFLAGKF
jgi:hypothetical protein